MVLYCFIVHNGIVFVAEMFTFPSAIVLFCCNFQKKHIQMINERKESEKTPEFTLKLGVKIGHFIQCILKICCCCEKVSNRKYILFMLSIIIIVYFIYCSSFPFSSLLAQRKIKAPSFSISEQNGQLCLIRNIKMNIQC